jgi:hypothetical protein
MKTRKILPILRILFLSQVICALMFSTPVFSAENTETQYRPAIIKYEDPQTGESYVVALIDYDDSLNDGRKHPTYQKLAKQILTNAKNWLIEGYKQDYKKAFPNLDPKFFDSLGTPLDGRSKMVVVYQDESLTKILGTMRLAYSTEDHPELPMHGPDQRTVVPDSRQFMGGYPYLHGNGDRISWELGFYGGPVGVEFKNFRKAPDAPDAVVPLMFYAAERHRFTSSIVPITLPDGTKTVSRPLWYQLECLDPLIGYYKNQGWKENGTTTTEFGPTLHYYLQDRLGFIQILTGAPDGKKGLLQRPGADFIRAAQAKTILYDDRYDLEEKPNSLLECLKGGFLQMTK